MSRVRRDSRSWPTAQHPRSPTGLSPSAVTRSSGLRLKDAGTAKRLPPPPAHSSNPLLASPAGYAASRVWAPPRSLAATPGILSVPRGTEMFQFPRCPPSPKTGSVCCQTGVAPFGDPWIARCQLVPRAFRSVAASFIGSRRLGIHRALIIVDHHISPTPISSVSPQRTLLPSPRVPPRLTPQTEANDQGPRTGRLVVVRSPTTREAVFVFVPSPNAPILTKAARLC